MTRAEAIEYYKQERERFEKTRGIQWKFGIGLWSLIALGIAFFGKEKIELHWIITVSLLFLFLLAHFLLRYLLNSD